MREIAKKVTFLLFPERAQIIVISLLFHFDLNYSYCMSNIIWSDYGVEWGFWDVKVRKYFFVKLTFNGTYLDFLYGEII